jgi:hypothetical protein
MVSSSLLGLWSRYSPAARRLAISVRRLPDWQRRVGSDRSAVEFLLGHRRQAVLVVRDSRPEAAHRGALGQRGVDHNHKKRCTKLPPNPASAGPDIPTTITASREARIRPGTSRGLCRSTWERCCMAGPPPPNLPVRGDPTNRVLRHRFKSASSIAPRAPRSHASRGPRRWPTRVPRQAPSTRPTGVAGPRGRVRAGSGGRRAARVSPRSPGAANASSVWQPVVRNRRLVVRNPGQSSVAITPPGTTTTQDP